MGVPILVASGGRRVLGESSVLGFLISIKVKGGYLTFSVSPLLSCFLKRLLDADIFSLKFTAVLSLSLEFILLALSTLLTIHLGYILFHVLRLIKVDAHVGPP